MCSLARSWNKGLREYQRRASWLCTGPSLPEVERQACDSQSWKARDCYNLSPRDSIFYQTVSRLPSANHVFLRSGLSRGDMRHTWDGALMAHLGNQAARTREGIKMHGPPGTVCSPSTWLPELLRPGKGTKCTPNLQRLNQSCAWVSPVEVWVSRRLPQGLSVQHTWVRHKPSWRRSP